MFYPFKQVMDDEAIDFESLADLEITDPALTKQLKRFYLQNEVQPISILLELTGSSLPQRVYVNVAPGHFVDEASVERVEGEMRVLGSVSHLIPEDDEGYLSAEQWLLHGWEHLVKRVLMTQIGDAVETLVDSLHIDLPRDDAGAFITGPAVVIDAIALYWRHKVLGAHLIGEAPTLPASAN